MRRVLCLASLLLPALACSSTTTNEAGSGGSSGAGVGGVGGVGGTGGSGGASVCNGPAPGAGGCALGSILSCAYCGHDCLNAKCTNGACEPGVVGTGPGYALALGTVDVFTHNDAGQELFRVGRSATDQDAPTLVATLSTRPMRILVSGNTVYVSQLGSIVRVPASGAGVSPETFTAHANADDRANDLLVDGDYVYFVANYAPGFRRKGLGASGGEEVVAEAKQSIAVRADASAFYFVEYGNGSDGTVQRVPREYLGNVTQADTVVSGLAFPAGIELMGDSLYFTEGSKLYRTAKTAKDQTSLSPIAEFGKEISALGTDGCSLYLTEGMNDPEGKVWRVSPDGGEKKQLASGHNVFLGAVRVTQAEIFFGGAGGVRRIMR